MITTIMMNTTSGFIFGKEGHNEQTAVSQKLQTETEACSR